MKITVKRQRLRSVMVDIEITSARIMTENCPAGLWQELKRKSFLTGGYFPPGSKIVIAMYLEDGKQKSGACHWDELPDEVKSVLKTKDDLWSKQ